MKKAKKSLVSSVQSSHIQQEKFTDHVAITVYNILTIASFHHQNNYNCNYIMLTTKLLIKITVLYPSCIPFVIICYNY